MAKYLSEAEIVGGKTLDESTITGEDNLTRSLREDSSPWGKVKAAAGDVGRSYLSTAERVAQAMPGPIGLMMRGGTNPAETAGAAANVIDMIPGTIAGMGRLSGYVGGYSAGRRAGGTPKEAAMAGKEAATQINEQYPEAVVSPYKRLAELAGPEAAAAYANNPVANAFKSIEHGTNVAGEAGESAFGLPAEHTAAGIDALMTLGGLGMVKGARPIGAVRDALKARAEAKTTEAKAAAEDRIREAVAEAEAKIAERVPVQEQINRTTGVTPRAAVAERTAQLQKDIKARAKQDKALQDELAARADTQPGEGLWTSGGKDYPVTITGEAMRGPDGELYVPVVREGQQGFVPAKELKRMEVEQVEAAPTPVEAAVEGKTRIAEPVLINDVPAPLKTGVEKLANDRAWDMTHEERIAVRDAARARGPLAVETSRARQAGAIDPDLLIGIGGGMALGAAAYTAYRKWEESRQQERDEQEFIRQPTPNKENVDPEMRMDQKKFTEMGLGAAALAGAVKAKGGSWHPEAVTRLADTLAKPLRAGDFSIADLRLPDEQLVHMEREGAKDVLEYVNKDRATLAHTERMVRGYLNKHAGTEADPLKDVKVPFGEGTKRWEELMDSTLKTRKVEAAFTREDSIHPGDAGGAPEGSHIWDIADRAGSQAIRSYLSHVADYLREHVLLPEKLGQYDLVRAVKETAKWDEQLAKKMADARAAEKTVSPIYREYPDGMYWQQLTKPGQFARESDAMGHSVRGYEPPASFQYERNGKWFDEMHPDWIEASGESGHPEYGHGGWDAIKSGEAKVYSLRDAKGESHATVEVQAGGRRSVLNADGVPVGARDVTGDITQIKGKQNRAPGEKYLPYIQDFVKGEKWGEVGDLQNTGLREINKGYSQDFPRATEAFLKENPGARYMTEAEMKKFEDPNYKSQQGSADPRLLAAVAAAGGVAAYAAMHPEDAEEAYSLGAVGMLGAGRGKTPQFIKATGKYAGEIVHQMDTVLGKSSTRLEAIDPQIRRQVRDTMLAVGVAATKASDKIEAFTKLVKQLPKEARERVESAYKSHDTHAMAEELKGKPALVSAYRELRNWLDETGDTLRSMGRFKEGLTEHMPRVVKDYEGLIEALGHTAKEGIEKLIDTANKKSLKENGREMTEVERSILIDNWLKKEAGDSSLPGFAKNRTIEMEKKLEPFYHTMEDSLIMYGHAATKDIAIARFFGKDLVQTKQGGKKFTNLNDSIGTLTGRLLDEGKITPKQAVEMQGILRAMFGEGQKAPSGFMQDVRNWTSLALLGQIGSGLIQTSEGLLSVYHHSMIPALQAAGTLLTGKGIKPKEFGLANHVIEEVIGKRFSGQALSLGLKINMLALFDQLGMKQNLTASYIKNRQLAQTPKGVEQLREKWGAAYGSDFPRLVKELRESSMTKRTDLVDSLMYGELSDIRPTSMAEVPEQFNRHPNLRFMWQLKQFMLSQADIVRRDAYNKIKTGEPRQMAIGFKNLALYGAALSVVTIPSDYIKSWIMGQDYKWDPAENVMRNFSLSRYSTDKISQSKAPGKAAVETVGGVVAPPVYSVGKTLAEGVSDPKKLVPMIPVGGRVYYNRELGGNEKIKANQKKQDRLDARDKLESREPWRKKERLERQKQRELKRAQQ